MVRTGIEQGRRGGAKTAALIEVVELNRPLLALLGFRMK